MGKGKESVDHIGNVYPTVSAMCAEYGITIHKYLDRISSGWSVEDALTRKKEPVRDHLGNEFKNQDEMCAYHSVKTDNYRRRIKRGLSVADALKPEKMHTRGELAWTVKEDMVIRKNIHLSNAEIAELLEGRTVAAVADRVRKLGLARVFQKHEVETLRKVWGNSRRGIERALPRFTWRQISKKAYNIGLPPLTEAREAFNLYTLISALGEGESTASKWIEAGLPITNDKGKDMVNSSLFVDIDTFWDFAASHTDIVDIPKLFTEAVENVLGVPSDEILAMRFTAKPIKKRMKHVRLSKKRGEDLARLFYSSDISTEKLAKMFDVSVDTVRRTACKHKKPGDVRSTKSVLTDGFLSRLEKLYYVDGLTYEQCMEILKCSKASIGRGIREIFARSKEKR